MFRWGARWWPCWEVNPDHKKLSSCFIDLGLAILLACSLAACTKTMPKKFTGSSLERSSAQFRICRQVQCPSFDNRQKILEWWACEKQVLHKMQRGREGHRPAARIDSLPVLMEVKRWQAESSYQKVAVSVYSVNLRSLELNWKGIVKLRAWESVSEESSTMWLGNKHTY